MECADRRGLDRSLNLGRRGCGRVRVSRGVSESSDLLELKQLKMRIYQHRSTNAQRESHIFWWELEGRVTPDGVKLELSEWPIEWPQQVLSLLLVHAPRYLGSAI